MKSILMVAVGGAIGSVARYALSIWLKQSYTYSFPWHTFIINILGCVLIGMMYAFTKNLVESETIRLMVMIGILGGFTTFSSFGLESFQLYESKAYTQLFLYISLTNILGILGVFSGYGIHNLLNK